MFLRSVVASSAESNSARFFLDWRHYLPCFKTFVTNVLIRYLFLDYLILKSEALYSFKTAKWNTS
jgi:hypothetical protein